MGLLGRNTEQKVAEAADALKEEDEEPDEPTAKIVIFKTYTYDYSEHHAVVHFNDGTSHEVTFDKLKEKSDRFILKDYTYFGYHFGRFGAKGSEVVATVMKKNLNMLETVERVKQEVSDTQRKMEKIPERNLEAALEDDNVYRPAITRVEE